MSKVTAPMAGLARHVFRSVTLSAVIALIAVKAGVADESGGLAPATSGPHPQRALCSCERLSPREARDLADAVFHGQAIAVEAVATPPFDFMAKTTFAVTTVWGKTQLPQEVSVVAVASESLCGYGFERGGQYLVFAHRSSGLGSEWAPFTTGYCERTQGYDPAVAAALGPGRKPLQFTPTATSTPLPTPTLPPCTPCATSVQPIQAMRSASVVFIGLARGREVLAAESWDLEVAFDVERVYTSGVVCERAVVHLPWSSWGCGGGPMPGQRWLVYADFGAGGWLTYDRCGRSRRITGPDDELGQLGLSCDPVSRMFLTVSPAAIRPGKLFTVTIETHSMLLKSTSLWDEPLGMAALEPPVAMPCEVEGNGCRTFTLRAFKPGPLRLDASGFGETVFCHQGFPGYHWAHPSAALTVTIRHPWALPLPSSTPTRTPPWPTVPPSPTSSATATPTQPTATPSRTISPSSTRPRPSPTPTSLRSWLPFVSHARLDRRSDHPGRATDPVAADNP